MKCMRIWPVLGLIFLVAVASNRSVLAETESIDESSTVVYSIDDDDDNNSTNTNVSTYEDVWENVTDVNIDYPSSTPTDWDNDTTTTTIDDDDDIVASTIESTEDDDNEGATCVDGMLLPVWRPLGPLTLGDRIARGLAYFLMMCYLFLGVSIVSDRFMSAIERITANEKEVKVRNADGTTNIVVVRVWNETVANLTLMALGTSAPEILLSIIEIFGRHFEAGELGPGTIVGSAAYNLFCIIALCVVVIPDGETRKIKHLRVFIVTASISVFAYIWMYAILAFFSPGEVEIWEGLLTFLFFPGLVYLAYVADQRLLVYKYLNKKYRMNERGVMVQAETGTDLEMNGRPRVDSLTAFEEGKDLLNNDCTDFEQARQNYIRILRDLRKKHPQYDKEHLEIMAQEQLMNNGPKSRAFYRIQATRKMVGSGNIMRKVAERAQTDLVDVRSEFREVEDELEEGAPFVRFEPAHYTVMESCGEFEVRVVRRGDFSERVTVDYETQNGSAEAGTDYVAKQGTLVFTPGVVERFIKIEVIDDDVFEQDEQFFIILSNITGGATLSKPCIATVMILDDDHCGIFSLKDKDHDIVESVGVYDLPVQRYSGARGAVKVPFWTEDGTAKAGKDYEPINGELMFDNNETE